LGVGALTLAVALLAGWLEVDDVARRGCLNLARVEARVEEALAPALVGGQARVAVRPAGKGVIARVELLNGHGALLGMREITSRAPGCRPLEDALVLHLTLAFEEAAAARTSTAVAAEPPPVVQAPVVAAAATGAAETPAPAPVDWQASVGAGGVAGALPGFGLGLALAAQTRWPRLSLGADARLDWALPGQRQDVRVEAWRPTAALIGCTHQRRLAACLGPRLGLLLARSRWSSTAPTVDVMGRLTLDVGARFGLYVEPAAALVRTRLTAGGRELWTTPRLSLAAGVLLWHR
jgi:hypothetical protein